MAHDVPDAAPARDHGAVWASRPLRVSAALALVAVVWFATQLVAGPVEPVLAGWLLSPASAALAAVLCHRAAGTAGVSPTARRFWRLTTLALAVFSVSMVSRIIDSINADLTMTARLSLHSAALHGIAVVLIVWPLARMPLGIRTGAQRAAFWLDITTLMACTSIFLWHFGPAVHAGTPDATVLAGLALMIGALLGVFVAAKVLLTGAAFVNHGALRTIGLTLTVAGVGPALSTQLAGHPYLDTTVVIAPVACLLLAVAARQETVAARTPVADATRPARRYSLTPYFAVVATDVLLVVAVATDAPDRLLIAGVAVVLTGLVIVRQVTAFRENDNLVNRLDAGMRALRDKEQRFRALVQNSTEVVSISSPEGVISYVSPALERVLGRSVEDLEGNGYTPLVHPDDAPVVAENIAHVATRPGNTATFQARLGHADGSWRWMEVISANLSDEPSVAGIVSNARDITETRQIQDRLSHEATHDALTGLANRTLFAERLHTCLAQARPGHRISIVLVDLDDFKTVNDTLGHAVGDALLMHVADRMRVSVRPTDVVARLGGDEFAILFEDLSETSVDDVLGRIAYALGEPAQIDDHLLTVQASFGVVDAQYGDDAGDLLRQADIAMYDAKERGDGGYQRYEPGMEARGAERSRHATALRAAIAEDQLVLHYQPVVTLPEGRITGVEALLRWQHPTEGLLGPIAFIDAAEQTGLIVPLGRWVLREATRQAAAWLAEYGDMSPSSVSVNASARQLREPNFAAEVAQALRDSGLPAHRLTIEITESTAVGGGATQDTLRRLRSLGVRLSLDDFGTGASTLSLLATCPVDQIKLDRSFAPVPGPDAIANAVVQLARAFGVEAVAEGVETPAQAARLESLGYLRAQGFHFARPMAPEQLSNELMSRLAMRP
ncbi:putative bifunctional diguanylate cyclase/phosphodiesterase [Jidongwangia harbinensis]|uniref:putative bifunctional diguanylate cyclase/phosphodiesterase n=1 Tax=Jidongwangia harbinensis TaxID=2878561 RepID=UPI001CDA1E53|nr:EAL domain-containing protein [Jidongwangia harbinensis]MCA2214484.1 EAL domain-containing protein [Jidongwangia harbinensis]